MLVRVLVRVGLVAVVVSLCLISSELVLRFLAPVSDPYDYLKRPESFNHYVKSWPGNYHLQTEAEPSLPGIEERAHFTTNKVGFRGGEIKRPKPKNEFRVFLIGGSTTECMYIDDDQAIDRALGRDLNRLLPNVLSARVFNTGRGGLKSDDHVAMLAQRIVHLLMFAKYSVGAQRAAPAPARHSLCPKSTLYSAGINRTRRSSCSCGRK